MKRVVSILFLVAILVQSGSSLYRICLFHLQRAYISENLCENRFDAVSLCKGKCYLNKELKKEEQKQDKFPDFKQKETKPYLPVTALKREVTHDSLILSSGFSSAEDFYSHQHCASIFHPPLHV